MAVHELCTNATKSALSRLRRAGVEISLVWSIRRAISSWTWRDGWAEPLPISEQPAFGSRTDTERIAGAAAQLSAQVMDDDYATNGASSRD